MQEGGDIHTHIADSLCYTAETNTTLQSNYTPIKILKKKKSHCHCCDHYSFMQLLSVRAMAVPSVSFRKKIYFSLLICDARMLLYSTNICGKTVHVHLTTWLGETRRKQMVCMTQLNTNQGKLQIIKITILFTYYH